MVKQFADMLGYHVEPIMLYQVGIDRFFHLVIIISCTVSCENAQIYFSPVIDAFKGDNELAKFET